MSIQAFDHWLWLRACDQSAEKVVMGADDPFWMLSTRAANGLKYANCKSLADAARLANSIEFYCIPNFGKTSRREVCQALKDAGLPIPEDAPSPRPPRRTGGPYNVVGLRLTDEELEALDELLTPVENVGAAVGPEGLSRSEVVGRIILRARDALLNSFHDD